MLRAINFIFKPKLSRIISTTNVCRNTTNEEFNLPEDREYEDLVEKCFGQDHTCYIINPYIKWAPRKPLVDPSQQLEEAVSLIRTLSSWKVHDTIDVPLENLQKNKLFGSGTAEKLKQRVRSDKNITAVFVNCSNLKNVQMEELEELFQVPIYDRYQIVLQILRIHAISKHAKLQVALAEVHYLKAALKKHHSWFLTGGDFDIKRMMLLRREVKVKDDIKKLRLQRELLRKKRRDMDFPVIAVVGYTNSGKTSLIKALTGDQNLRPRNQLFATLDVTVHAGLLNSNLEVLYVDTVGFISNIPTNLMECFIATLEDALYADVILHVSDLSAKDREYQEEHVLTTIQNLTKKMGGENIMGKLLTVGNKCDLVPKKEDGLSVSAVNGIGLDDLREELEEQILKATGRSVMKLRVPIGGDESRWLYKNATVSSLENDENQQLQIMEVIITPTNLQKFKHLYITNKK